MNYSSQAWEWIARAAHWLLRWTERLASQLLPKYASRQIDYIEGIVAEWIYLQQQYKVQGVPKLNFLILIMDVLRGIAQLVVDSYLESPTKESGRATRLPSVTEDE